MISWNINFSCDNEEIDKQHKKMIGIIEKIVSIISNNEFGFTALLDVTTELDDYVDQHFKYEEELMIKYNYPNRVEHIKQHDILRQKMSQLNVFDFKADGTFFYEILEYLVNWLAEHIVGTDKKLGRYIAEKKIC
ncbi:MAG: hemerythrin family protein [Bacillota bacterium]|nr:hemerythrin family protein [Bacillota bacterium]